MSLNKICGITDCVVEKNNDHATNKPMAQLKCTFCGSQGVEKTLKCGEMEMIFIQDTCLRFGLNMPYFIFKINVTAPNIPWVKHKNGLR